MPTWDHDDCHPLIEAEHHRLYRMMDHLQPAIFDEDNHVRTARAIAALKDRMTDHFRMEEELFITADWSSRQVMMRDHRQLLAMLTVLADTPLADVTKRRRLFTDFLEALARHDNDVDAPLFSLKN